LIKTAIHWLIHADTCWVKFSIIDSVYMYLKVTSRVIVLDVFLPIYLKVTSGVIVLDVVFLASLELDTVNVLLCYTLSNFDHYIKLTLYLNSTEAIKRKRKCLCNRINNRSLYMQTCFCTLRSWWSVLDATSCDSVCQWLEVGRWFSPGTSVCSTNKTDRHDITEILLKVAINTIN